MTTREAGMKYLSRGKQAPKRDDWLSRTVRKESDFNTWLTQTTEGKGNSEA